MTVALDEVGYRALVEQVPAVVVLFALGEPGPVPVYVSPQTEPLLGVTVEQWLTEPERVIARVHPDDLVLLQMKLAQQAVGIAAAPAEFRFRRPDGEELWLRDVSGLVTDGSGARRLQMLLVDVTEAKRAEAARAALQAERELARKLEAVGQLAAGIAHEINTPIQFVGDTIGFLQEALGDLLTLSDAYETLELSPEQAARVRAAAERADLAYLRERVPAAVERGADGIARVAAIVRAMHGFAHPGATGKEPADLVAALRDTLVVAGGEYRHVARLETDFEPLPEVVCNVGELNQAFLNLVVNAAHAVAATGRRGTITVSTRAEDDGVLVSIADTGAGIPDDVAARVFDPFFTTKDVGEGSGQGLAIARTMIVERHGGTLTFESEPSRGTTFHVRLPAQSS